MTRARGCVGYKLKVSCCSQMHFRSTHISDLIESNVINLNFVPAGGFGTFALRAYDRTVRAECRFHARLSGVVQFLVFGKQYIISSKTRN
jgi:hypothetical protein